MNIAEHQVHFPMRRNVHVLSFSKHQCLIFAYQEIHACVHGCLNERVIRRVTPLYSPESAGTCRKGNWSVACRESHAAPWAPPGGETCNQRKVHQSPFCSEDSVRLGSLCHPAGTPLRGSSPGNSPYERPSKGQDPWPWGEGLTSVEVLRGVGGVLQA